MAIKRSSSQKTTSSSASVAISGSGSSVTITSYTVTDSSYNNLDDTAVATTGGYIKINGTGFTGAATVYINGSLVTSTYISTTEIRAVVPALSAGSYILWVFVGTVGAAYSSLVTSGFPSWTSSSYTSTSSIVSVQLLATGDGTLTYSLYSGTLPSGLSLSSTGLISGTVTEDSVTSDLVFLVNDSQNQTTQQTVSLTIVTFDPYWENTTGLLQGDTAPFISDASTNVFTVTPAGDVRPYNFNPYTPGYYSNYFASNYISVANNTALNLSSGVWTIELWFFWDGTSAGYKTLISKRVSSSVEYEIGLSNTLTNPATYFYNGALSTGGSVTSNVWHHLAAVYDATNTKIYLDGSLVVTYAGTAVTGTNTLQIGIDGSLTQAFPGYISNVRILKGTALYTTTFTPPTTPLTAIANTVLLTCQSNRFIDNSTNAFTVTPTSGPQIKSQHPFTPSSDYASYGSGYFDGTGDYISVADNTALRMGSGDWTAEAWIYITSYTLVNMIICKGGTTTDWFLGTNATTGRLYFGIDTTDYFASTGPVVSLNAWHHVALVRSGTTLTTYLDGVLGNTQTSMSQNFSSTGEVRIGRGRDTSSNYLSGYVSNARLVKGTAVYTSAFTPPTSPLTAISGTSLLTLQTNLPHNNNTILDDSTNDFAITRSGSPVQGTFSPYSGYYSNYFDGTGDYLDVTSSSITLSSNWTVECWFNTSVVTGIIFDFRPDGSNGYYPQLSGTGNGTQLNFNYNAIDYAVTVGTYLNQWNHVAIVKNSGTLSVYFNGASVYSVSNSNTWSLGTNRPRIGANGGFLGAAPAYYTGYVSNVRIVNGTAVYTGAFTPPTIPLTSVTDTRLLTCQSNRLIDNSTNAYTITKNGDVTVKPFSPFNRTSEYSIASNGGSVYFDGSSYLTCAPGSAFAFGTGDFTVECWVYPTATPAYQYIIDARNSGQTTSWAFAFGLNGAAGDSGKFGWYSGGATLQESTVTVGVNAWYHLCYTRSSNTGRLFVNGVQVATAVDSTNISVSPTLSYIGTRYSDLGNNKFTGYISNLRVVKVALYTSAFTPPTVPVVAIQNTGLLIDGTSGAVIDGTMNGNILTSADARVLNTQYKYGNTTTLTSGSLYFDGTGDYMTMPYIPTLYDWWQADFTIEAWVYPVSLATWQFIDGALTSPNMIGNNAQGGTSSYWTFGPIANGTVKFSYYSGTAQSKSSTATISTGSWSHIAMSKTSSGITIFVNGTASTTTAVSGTPQSSATVNPLTIGRGNSVTINGYVDDLRITRGYARYVANFTVPSLAFKAR